MTTAKVIAHSLFDDVELITFEVEFHRFILPELNTHRVFSRNYQSSRAVPIARLIDQVENNPAMPVHWGENKSGMIAERELDSHMQDAAKLRWKEAAKNAVREAEILSQMGVHKQVVNRLLEPFMLTRGVITTTDKGLKSFLDLRLHKDAQPEIAELAAAMHEAESFSAPNKLNSGDWHTPYFGDGYWSKKKHSDKISRVIKISTSCVAQVSYRQLDDSVEKAYKIYSMLNLPSDGVYPNDPPHFSPSEHCAMALTHTEQVKMQIARYEPTMIGGNFDTYSFYQYRKMLEQGNEKHYTERPYVDKV